MSSGTVAVWAMKDGDYEPTEFAGTTAGLQDAINYPAGGKGKVFIGPGTILLTEALTLQSNLTLQGSGMGQTVLKHSGTTLHTILSASSKNDFILQDFTIDGDQTGVSTYNADRWLREETIDLATCTDVVIRDVEITACRGQSIYGTSCSRVTVEGCYIHDTDNWGCVFKVADDMDFIGNHIENIFTHGIDVDAQSSAAGSSRIRYIGNTCINAQYDSAHTDSGIGFSVQRSSLPSGVYDFAVIGNVSKNCGSMGFSIVPDRYTDAVYGKGVVIGNHSEGHTSNVGIGYECIGTNIVFDGNTAKNNKFHFTAQNSARLIWVNNVTISALGSSQIAFGLFPAGVADAVAGVRMQGNIVVGGTGFQGGTVAAALSDIVVHGNSFLGCEYGVLIQAGPTLNRVVISGNYIDASGATLGRGIQAVGSNLIIENNQIAAKTSADAITIGAGMTTPLLVLRGNRITSGDVGFKVSGSTTTAYVSGNQIGTMTTSLFATKSNIANWRDSGDNSWSYVTASPTTEYWHVGTKVYDTAVAPSSFIGWVCTTAGTPGTWKTWGATSA